MYVAMTNMSDHMHFNETGLDTEEGPNDSEETKVQKRVRERRDDRRKHERKEKLKKCKPRSRLCVQFYTSRSVCIKVVTSHMTHTSNSVRCMQITQDRKQVRGARN